MRLVRTDFAIHLRQKYIENVSSFSVDDNEPRVMTHLSLKFLVPITSSMIAAISESGYRAKGKYSSQAGNLNVR